MLRTLQAGRGLAALAVAAFHLTILMQKPKYGGNDVFSEWTSRGFMGVDFFFVLSGFIILLAHQRDIGKPAAWGAYVSKRFVRLYPIYWLYTAAFVIALALGFGTTEIAPDWLSTVTLIRFSGGETPIPQAWTLFHEVVFYLAFSVLIWNRRAGLVLMALWGASVLLVFSYPDLQRSPFLTVFGAFNLNFFIGMAAFLAHKRLSSAVGLGLIVGGVGLIALMIVGENSAILPKILRLGWGVAFGAILAGAAAIEHNRGPMEVPGVSFLGDASYSVYLIHSLVMSVVMKVLMMVGVAQVLPPSVVYFLILIVSVAACCVAYLLVEKPLLAFSRGLIQRRGPPRAQPAPSAS